MLDCFLSNIVKNQSKETLPYLKKPFRTQSLCSRPTKSLTDTQTYVAVKFTTLHFLLRVLIKTKMINRAGVGCSIDNVVMNYFSYTDDMVLLGPPVVE